MNLFSKKEMLAMKEFVRRENKKYSKSVDSNKNYELQEKNKAINDIYIHLENINIGAYTYLKYLLIHLIN